MSDIFPIEVDGLLLTKAVISIGIVVALSLIAERVGPRAAGLLTGLPLGGGMVIIFTGAEQGTAFATEAAAHMVPGFVTTLTFIYLYGIVSVCQQLGGIKAIGMPLLVANLGYAIVAWLVSIISLGVLISIPLVIVGMILTSRAMINLPNTPIRHDFNISCDDKFTEHADLGTSAVWLAGLNVSSRYGDVDNSFDHSHCWKYRCAVDRYFDCVSNDLIATHPCYTYYV